MTRAIRMYEGFHQHEPKRIGSFHKDLAIPESAVLVGNAVNVLYRSDKLNPESGKDEGWIDYIHDHSHGVKVYRTDAHARRGDRHGEVVPHWLRSADELVWLGHCLGFAYKDDDGHKVEAKGKRPLPELYTIPSGKALLVVQSKRHLLAMIWGGKLGVEPRGIVH